MREPGGTPYLHPIHTEKNKKPSQPCGVSRPASEDRKQMMTTQHGRDRTKDECHGQCRKFNDDKPGGQEGERVCDEKTASRDAG